MFLLMFVSSKNINIGFVMLTSPKTRPELTRSMKDIYIFLDNKPNNE